MNVFTSYTTFEVGAVMKKLRQQAKHLGVDCVGCEWPGAKRVSSLQDCCLSTTVCPYHARQFCSQEFHAVKRSLKRPHSSKISKDAICGVSLKKKKNYKLRRAFQYALA